jgi:hypothetical protein
MIMMMKLHHHRRQMVLSILALLLLVATGVNSQIAEQDDVGRVSIRGEEDDRNDNRTNSRGDDEDAIDDEETTNEETIGMEEAGEEEPAIDTLTPPIQKSAWIYHFDSNKNMTIEDMKRHSGSMEDVEIQGTKEFIIVYKQPDDFGIAEEILASTDAAVQSTVADNGGSITFEYNTALNGVSASLTNEALEALMTQDGIDFIEEVIPMYASTTWGQDRVDEKDRTPSLDYIWERDRNAGAGVNVCVRCVCVCVCKIAKVVRFCSQSVHFFVGRCQVIDTGVDETYLRSSQLNLVGGTNFASGSSKGTYSWNDCNKHGTHVAGTGMLSCLDEISAKHESLNRAFVKLVSFNLVIYYSGQL